MSERGFGCSRPRQCGMRRRALVMSALTVIAGRATGRTWKFTDDRGVVHIGNRNPPNDAGTVTWLGPDNDIPPPEVVPPPTALPRYRDVRDALNAAAKMNRLDPAMVTAVAAVESAFDAKAISKKGAVGLMQVMPATALRYGLTSANQSDVVEQLLDPWLNANMGALILADLMRKMNRKVELVLAAYNAGEGAVKRFGSAIPPFLETERYVMKVLKLYAAWYGM
ncbi:lytic transglycosylase domain-containing protein [Tepidimonas taiwanensis]|uniref:lytic transglycosylase domain-containing protein n=1 Tax=Tepidimonas taiwanensis TaxID=307486 RepID=UPI0009DF6360|nr:lytic transglycosylase domain-containing protein [Tepidimonas taiwanensis]